jgi:glutamyl-tRNA synthetase
LHIGGARTALYNYLLAQQAGGRFILRIEDTDQKRSDPRYQAELMAGLAWLGLAWDEGPDIGGPNAPYNQVARREIYAQHAEQLIATGHAYPCFCSLQRLQGVRETQQRRKQPPRYDGLCRAIPAAEAAARRAAGAPHVIRFKSPLEGTTTVRDHLRGEITVDNRNVDDYILVKSDGLALYHLAAMVDDHLMGVTHVIRGDEWLASLPLHSLIYRAFGWNEPEWCHLSVFLKPSGKGKMSKRDLSSEQSIFVLGLRDLGYIPEAIVNWVVLMGWSLDDKTEVFTLEDLVKGFSLDRLNPSPAAVNFEKLDHYNGLHIRRLAVDDLAARLEPFFERAGLAPGEHGDLLRRVAPLVQERIVTLDDAVDMAGFFFRGEVSPDPAGLVAKGLTPGMSLAALRRAREVLAGMSGFDHGTTEPTLRALAEALGLKAGQLFGILRVAVTGQSVATPLFETMEIIGRETVLQRLDRAEALLAELDGVFAMRPPIPPSGTQAAGDPAERGASSR